MSTNSGWRLTRRLFLRSSGAALAAAALPGSSFGEAGAVRFGMITDLHYADADTRGTRHYRDSLAKMRECTALMNEKKVDFMIQLGDLKDQTEPPVEAATLEYLKTMEAAYAEFTGPRYHVFGNHDMDSLSKAQNLHARKMEKTFYSFERAGVRFVVLDANFKADDTDYDHGNFNYVECRIPKGQAAWLEAELASAGSGPVIVFVHQRLDGEGAVFVNNAAEIRAIIEKAGNVRAVFQGHDHRGDRRVINGINYYTLKGAIEGAGPENNAYCIVEVRPGGLTVEAYRKAVAFAIP